MITANHTITFKYKTDTDTDSQIYIVLDDSGSPAENPNMTDDGIKSEFLYGETSAFIVGEYLPDVPYELDVLTSKDMTYTVAKIGISEYSTSDEISFNHTDTGSLNKIPSGTPVTEWIILDKQYSEAETEIQFTGKEIKLSQKVSGKLRVEYMFSADLWYVTLDSWFGCPDEFDLEVSAVQNDKVASCTVKYKKPGAEEYDGDLSIQLADQKASWNTNIESENEDGSVTIKDSFASGDTATLALTLINGEIPYTVKPLVGNAVYFNYIITDVSETLTFTETDEATLSKYPEGNLTSSEWQLTDPGNVSISLNQKTVKLNQTVFGILNVTYKTKIWLWRMVYEGEEAEIPVLLSQYGKNTSCTVKYSGIETEEPGLYNIKIIDHCTKEAVQGAAFTFQGKSFVTDKDGKAFVGELGKGYYKIGKIIKEGYIDSDIDPLSNEDFEIT